MVYVYHEFGRLVPKRGKDEYGPFHSVSVYLLVAAKAKETIEENARKLARNELKKRNKEGFVHLSDVSVRVQEYKGVPSFEVLTI